VQLKKIMLSNNTKTKQFKFKIVWILRCHWIIFKRRIKTKIKILRAIIEMNLIMIGNQVIIVIIMKTIIIGILREAITIITAGITGIIDITETTGITEIGEIMKIRVKVGVNHFTIEEIGNLLVEMLETTMTETTMTGTEVAIKETTTETTINLIITEIKTPAITIITTKQNNLMQTTSNIDLYV
jgi:hypothetical protein